MPLAVTAGVMFRVTTEEAPDMLVLKLEGSLSGPWVDALDACWREAMESVRGRPVRVDLRDVLSIDESGRRLLTRMHDAGAGLVASGCFISELVREISEAVCLPRRSR
jgi:hypothetical protein